MTDERPQGVRVKHRDGTETPVELADRGLDERGIHVWEVMVGSFDPQSGDKIACDVLPGRTAIQFGVPMP